MVGPVRPGCREGRGSRGRGRRRPGAPAPCPAAPSGRAGSPATGAGTASARMKPSNPAGSVTSRKRASLGADDERVRDVARAEHERPGPRDDRLARDPDRELALEDVEPLVLVVVDVQRRAAAARRDLLGHHHATAGAGAVGLDRRQPPEEPEVLSLAGPVSDGCEGAVRRGRHGASCVDGVHACSLIAATARRPSPAHGDLSCAACDTGAHGMVGRAPGRRDRPARRAGTAARGVLRRALPAAAQRHRQRRQLLAHAGPAARGC